MPCVVCVDCDGWWKGAVRMRLVKAFAPIFSVRCFVFPDETGIGFLFGCQFLKRKMDSINISSLKLFSRDTELCLLWRSPTVTRAEAFAERFLSCNMFAELNLPPFERIEAVLRIESAWKCPCR